MGSFIKYCERNTSMARKSNRKAMVVVSAKLASTSRNREIIFHIKNRTNEVTSPQIRDFKVQCQFDAIFQSHISMPDITFQIDTTKFLNSERKASESIAKRIVVTNP